MLIFTPLHETNTQALRIHTVHFAASVICRNTASMSFECRIRINAVKAYKHWQPSYQLAAQREYMGHTVNS